jgi:hypothetical protein
LIAAGSGPADPTDAGPDIADLTLALVAPRLRGILHAFGPLWTPDQVQAIDSEPAGQRTTRTGQCACSAQAELTDPMSSSAKPP